MYDDIIENITYSLAMNGIDGFLHTVILKFCGDYAIDFFGFLGICLGVKFLKDSFK